MSKTLDILSYPIKNDLKLYLTDVTAVHMNCKLKVEAVSDSLFYKCIYFKFLIGFVTSMVDVARCAYK